VNAAAALLKRTVHQTAAFGWMVGFSHSICVLPFALAAVVLARGPAFQSITWAKVFWVTVAALSCRSAAIGFNRLSDMRWDRLNPRTRHWALPRGLISPNATLALVMLSAAVFFMSMGILNLTALYLSPVVLAIAFFHAFTKRFTWTSHLFLGLVYGMAPVVAWIAVRGVLHSSILVLGALIAAWGAGFDVIYACLDHAFDREWGLYSMPQTFGVTKAVWTARALHVLSLVGMLALKWVFALNAFYLFGVIVVGLLLLWGHSLAGPNAPMATRKTFFDASGLVSMFYFVAIAGGATPSRL